MLIGETSAEAAASSGRLQRLIDRAAALDPLPTVVAHPCDRTSLQSVAAAAALGLIEPLLVGPPERIAAVASAANIDIASFAVEPTPHSHASAVKAVELVRAGRGALLMKGSLHTNELMQAVVDRRDGLRTERRVSHVYVMEVSTYPRLLMITDAAVNVAPDLRQKRDIVQNAIELALALGIERPRVAVLSAVETVDPGLQSTLDAAALCKMAERGQIVSGLVDGPLAFDNAVSLQAAKDKGLSSPVAGQADILVTPDLESGNMLAKQLTFLAGADAAGIVLGAKVPIILTSRADSERAHVASCAVARLMAEHGFLHPALKIFP